MVEFSFMFASRSVLPVWRSGPPDNAERENYEYPLSYRVALTMPRLPRPASGNTVPAWWTSLLAWLTSSPREYRARHKWHAQCVIRSHVRCFGRAVSASEHGVASFVGGLPGTYVEAWR